MKNRIYLDTESTGLMGPLNLIQLGTPDGNVLFIRPFLESEKMERLRGLLDDPENLFIGYNVKHDLWKLYQYFKPAEPFAAHFLDLMHLIRTSSPLSPFLGKGTKSVARLSGIYEPVAEAVGKYVCERIQSLVPPGLFIEFSRHQKKKNFVDLSFYCRIDAKLKNVIRALFPSEREFLQKIEDTGWKFVEEEKMHLGCWDRGRREEYLTAWSENEKILDTPGHPFLLYARKDIEYLILLDRFFSFPEPALNDSISEIVAWTRFHGFGLDLIGLRNYIGTLEKKVQDLNQEFSGFVDLTSPSQRLSYLNSRYGLGLRSTGKKYMARIKRTLKSSEAIGNLGVGIFADETSLNPLAGKALEDIEKIEKYNAYVQRLNQAKKLAEAGRAHPDFREIGTASGRMAGSGGLNFQGIDRSKYGIRSFFRLSCGGDFDSLELNLAAYLYSDPEMQEELKHMDMHLKTSLTLFNPSLSYSEALKIKEDKTHERFSEVKEKRQIGKLINFSKLYFCSVKRTEDILSEAGLSLLEARAKAKEIYTSFDSRFPALKTFGEKLEKLICTLSPDSWETAEEDVSRMNESVENCFGFKRFFSFEKLLCSLFVSDSGIERVAREEAERLGIEKEKIVRSELKGLQTIGNSVLSARLGAVLNIQRAVFRAAGNHIVQSSGADLTKRLMADVWNDHRVPVMNIHDEILIPEGFEEKIEGVQETLKVFLKKYQTLIPTLSMSLEKMGLWSEK